jgi:hypothetical protein
MGGEFINIYIIAILLLILYIYYESKSNDVSYVESVVDGHKYLVRNKLDKKEAADLLAKIKIRMIKLTDHLEQNKSKEDKVQRLVSNFRPDEISESTPDSKYTSYSVNKGEKIVFCLRSRDKNEDLVDENVLTFVALHELAHIMTKSVGHTKEFWDNFKYLLKIAIKIGIYSFQDFREEPVEYCGTQITDSPLKKSELMGNMMSE